MNGVRNYFLMGFVFDLYSIFFELEVFFLKFGELSIKENGGVVFFKGKKVIVNLRKFVKRIEIKF